jgi:hypothetical protein
LEIFWNLFSFKFNWTIAVSAFSWGQLWHIEHSL